MQTFDSILAVNRPDSSRGYVGRFAPSPSGDLHFGSLVTALTSFLQARQNSGKWLLRIDDIDQTRCKPEFTSAILHTLEQHGLQWDGNPLYQNRRLALYDAALTWLQNQDLTYFCQCTRKEIKARGPLYTGTCRDKQLQPTIPEQQFAVRLKNPATQNIVEDRLLGKPDIPREVLYEDFVLQRRDRMHAYHLVSVVDDIEQGITEVVRGADLLFPSVCQAVLYSLFGAALPEFLHIPVAVSEPGRKLSKQNLSPPVNNRQPSNNIVMAAQYLGAEVPGEVSQAPPEQILDWLLLHWNWKQITPIEEKRVENTWC